jgi:hypothetical protein
VALNALRDVLERCTASALPIITADRSTVGLIADAVESDVAQYEGELQKASDTPRTDEKILHLARAVGLYGGPLLPGVYEEWVTAEQERLGASYAQALRDLAGLLEQTQQSASAIPFLTRLLDHDPLAEDAVRAMMRIHAANGGFTDAVQQYRAFEAALAREVGTAPHASTRALAKEILAAAQGTSSFRERSTPSPLGDAPAGGASPVVSSIGGAVSLDSAYYVPREIEPRLYAHIRQRTSIILLKGMRESGKTSVLARGLQHGREHGCQAIHTDFRMLNNEQLETTEVLLRAMARLLSDALELPGGALAGWDPEDGPNVNFHRFVRRLLELAPERRLLWGLDGVDRILPRSYASEVFSVFRVWHNERALNPQGPWSRMCVILAYSAEANQFITDSNQSPFNVGVELTLTDFTREQVELLNRQFGAPLRSGAELDRFGALLGGHPFLLARGFGTLAENGGNLDSLEQSADREDGVFGGHLRRIRALLESSAALRDGLDSMLQGRKPIAAGAFYALKDAGIVVGDTPEEGTVRCGLYRQYLLRHFPPDRAVS